MSPGHEPVGVQRPADPDGAVGEDLVVGEDFEFSGDAEAVEELDADPRIEKPAPDETFETAVTVTASDAEASENGQVVILDEIDVKKAFPSHLDVPDIIQDRILPGPGTPPTGEGHLETHVEEVVDVPSPFSGDLEAEIPCITGIGRASEESDAEIDIPFIIGAPPLLERLPAIAVRPRVESGTVLGAGNDRRGKGGRDSDEQPSHRS